MQATDNDVQDLSESEAGVTNGFESNATKTRDMYE